MGRDSVSERISSILIIPLIQGLLIVCAFLALIARDRHLLFISILALAVVILASLWARRGIGGLGISVAVENRRLFPGEETTLLVRIENRTRLPFRYRGSILNNVTTDDNGSIEGIVMPRAAETRTVQIRVRRRGVVRLGFGNVEAGDLLGFYWRMVKTEAFTEIIVYPRIRPVGPIALTRLNMIGRPGGIHCLTDPLYPVGTREYRGNRPARFIDWKATARHDCLQERIFEPSMKAKVLFLLDAEGYDRLGGLSDFEQMVEAAASIAADFARQGAAVGIATNSHLTGINSDFGILPAATGTDHLPPLLEILARCEPRAFVGLAEILHEHVVLSGDTTVLYLGREESEITREIQSFFTGKRSFFAIVDPRDIILTVDENGYDEREHPAERAVG